MIGDWAGRAPTAATTLLAALHRDRAPEVRLVRIVLFIRSFSG